jgi:hypothetical protein
MLDIRRNSITNRLRAIFAVFLRPLSKQLLVALDCFLLQVY